MFLCTLKLKKKLLKKAVGVARGVGGWVGKVGTEGRKRTTKIRRILFLFFNEQEEREGIMKQNTSCY